MAEGRVFFPGGGGSGSSSSDDTTAIASHVLKGKTYIGADTDDEVGTGTMPDNSTLTSNGTVPGISTDYPNVPTREGTNVSPQYHADTNGVNRISMCPPPGYYPGNGSSYVNAPASKFGNARASQVLTGKSFTSANGLAITGTMPHLTNDATIMHTSDNTTKVLVGDAIYMPTNSDGVKRFEIHYKGEAGYIASNTLLAYPASKLGSAIASQVLSGKTFTSESGIMVSGTMANVGAIDAAKSVSISNNVFYARMTNGAHVTNSTSGYPEVSISCNTLRGRTQTEFIQAEATNDDVGPIEKTFTIPSDGFVCYELWFFRTNATNRTSILTEIYAGSTKLDSLVSELTGTWEWSAVGATKNVAKGTTIKVKAQAKSSGGCAAIATAYIVYYA